MQPRTNSTDCANRFILASKIKFSGIWIPAFAGMTVGVAGEGAWFPVVARSVE